MPILKIENATKVFNLSGNIEDRRVALDNLTLEVEEGEWITIIGGNGSGKSTLMNIISGVHLLEQGSIYINGENVTKYPEYKRAKYLGRVFQDPNMGTAGKMSIEENLSIAYRRTSRSTLRWGFDKKKHELFKEKLSILNLGLDNRISQRVGLLSGGQRQAVTLIMATINEPKILLLDEHTAALDPKTAKIVLDITEKIVTSSKITTLMITHNMKDAIKYGNRLIMLNEGKIVFDIKGEEKKKLTAESLLQKFDENQDIVFDDKLILSK